MYVIKINNKETLSNKELAEKIANIAEAIEKTKPSNVDYHLQYIDEDVGTIESKIIAQTKHVLECQSKYFAARSPELLRQSKAAESALKKLIQQYEDKQTRLF